MRPRRLTAVLLPAALLLAAGACGLVTDPDSGPPSEITELPRDLTPAEQELIRTGNAFGLGLVRRLHAGREADEANVFLSPLSASMSLGMAMNGAEDETFDQMRATLGLGELDLPAANDAYGRLVDLLLGLDPSVEFRLANAAWLREGFPIRAAYRDRVERAFDARVASLDFRSPAAADTINAWVEEQTDGRIRDFVSHRRITNLIALLANTVYFEGSWTERFDPDETREGDFRRPDGSTVTVPLMSRTLDAGHYRDEQLAAADLPYGGQAFSMTVVVPGRGETLAGLVEELDRERWRTIVAGLSEREIRMTLPRFELTYEKLLNDALKAMGMERAFDPDSAEFGRMVEGAKPGDFWIQWVKQKSFVKVDEEGTEAAAATGTGVGPVSAPPAVRADRPFVFAIRERLSGTILFVGTVTDPTAG